MKIKKVSMLSLVLALALVVGVTTGFATSAANVAEQNNPALGQMEFNNSKTLPFAEDINLGEDNEPTGFVQIVGGQTYNEYETVNINDLNRTDAADILENAQPMAITLISVSHDDEHKFSPEEWSQILKLIDEGKISWED